MSKSGFKSLGDAGWVGFFSNIFHDRDVQDDAPHGERFTLEAHEEYAKWANSDPANLPELQLFHLPNVVMGKAAGVQVVGPMIVAYGPWGEDEIGQKAKAFFADTKDEWAMSHGFTYWPSDRTKGEYRRYRTHEVTVLPPEWAANPATVFMEGSSMSLKDDIQKALQGVLGADAETAAQIAEEGMTKSKALSDAAAAAGAVIGQKDGEAAPATEPAETPAADEEAVSDDDLAVALAEALLANEALAAQAEEVGKQLKSLQEEFGELKKSVKALQDAEAQRKSLLPRAVAQAIAQRASEKGTEVDPGDVERDAKQQQEALGAKSEPDAASDPLGWMAKQAGMPLVPPKQ